jgi:hypothetical protein
VWWAAWAVLLLGQAAVIWLLCRRSAQRDDGVAPQQLLQALQMLDVRLQQLERGAQATQMAVAKSDGGLDRVSQQLQAHLAQAQLDAQAARREQGEALAAFRMELGRLTVRLAADSAQAREAQGESTQRFNAHVQERFEALAQTTRSTLDSLKNDIQQQLGGLAQSSQVHAEQLRGTLNERLATIQSDNAARLEEMRRTGDSRALVARTDVDPDPDRRRPCRRHELGDHPQTARQDGATHRRTLLGRRLRAPAPEVRWLSCWRSRHRPARVRPPRQCPRQPGPARSCRGCRYRRSQREACRRV